ncbi:MAG TPA: formylglycine-generating enzyme family protein [Planctomycetota bacterium]|nr:formylglycine-generating enzyme family protein [Planctomycetota bacterium]
MRTLAFAVLLLAPAPAQEPAALLRTFREEFVPIPAGTFQIGDAPGRPVTLAAFQIGKYEVPQNLWTSVMGQNPSRWTGKRNSVEMLSFDDAVGFCRKATELLRAAKLIEADQAVRLPTEAEWEYAARAGTKTKYSFGDDAKELDAYGWFHGNAAGNDPPVGAKKPNPWGLYDVHGYLWEWCDGHVIRGGSWKDDADALASSSRKEVAADLKDDAVGLRCVLAPEKK